MSNDQQNHLTGIVHAIMPPETGKSKAGKEWSKQAFVIEVPSQYPYKAAFEKWGDPVEFATGDTVTVFFDLESREWNDKWFTNAKAWRIAVDKSGSGAPGHHDTTPFGGEDDELPF